MKQRTFLSIFQFLLLCYLTTLNADIDSQKFQGPYQSGYPEYNGAYFYPHHFRTPSLICEPETTPRAEEICLRRCSSDDDCRYKSATMIIPSFVNFADRQQYTSLVDSFFSGASSDYRSSNKPTFLDWTCDADLGYCIPYSDDGCNFGWRRTHITGAVSLTIEDKIGTLEYIGPTTALRYERIYRTAGSADLYYRMYYIENGVEARSVDFMYTSYMCQCIPNPVYNSCNGGTCEYVVYIEGDINQRRVNSLTTNIQFRTAAVVSTGSLSYSASTKLTINGLPLLSDGFDPSYRYTYCSCPDGTHGTSCNNIIDNCGLLYCGNKGACAKDVTTTQPSIQVIPFSPSYYPPGTIFPSFIYVYQFNSYPYWMKDVDRSVTLAITNYIAPQKDGAVSVSNCYCEFGKIPFNPIFINSAGDSPLAILPNPDASNANSNGCILTSFNYLCCGNKGVWPNSGDTSSATFQSTCIQKFGNTGIYKPCSGSSCYGFNCELTCDQLCSGHALNSFTSCNNPVNFTDPDASLNKLCLSCEVGYGPPARSSTWRAQVSQTYKIFSNSIRFCNLIYSRPPDQPNGEYQECGGSGYSINLDTVSSILGLNRTLIGVVKRANRMELNFDPLVLIPSYEGSVTAYVDENNQARIIRDHPAFRFVVITEFRWKAYIEYYYKDNIGTRCTCAEGYLTNEVGTCISNSCDKWLTIHPSDRSGLPPNGLTCGGYARSYSGCKETPLSKYCTCREGFTGTACEQVLCAHANGHVCSGNGQCDSEFNTCLCKPGYVGVACEIKLESANPCSGNGQQTKSFPLPSYNKETEYIIPPELDVKVEWL